MVETADEPLPWDTERGVSGGSVDLAVSRDLLGSSLPGTILVFKFDPHPSTIELDLGALIVLARGAFSSKLFTAAVLVHLQ